MTSDFDTLDDGIGRVGLTLSMADKENLRSAGKWGRFLAIVTFVFLGLGLIGALFAGGTMMSVMTGSDMGGFGALSMVLYLLAFVFYGVIAYLVYEFSTKAIRAVDNDDQTAMTASFRALKRLYAIFGILTVITLGFYLFIILFGAAAAFI